LQVLRILLERPGEIVTRDELRNRIWPSDTFVDFDGGLSNAIKRLRQALGDSADKPRFIETIPRRGYRLLAAVNCSAAPGSEGAQRPANDPQMRMGVLIGVGAVVLVGVLLAATPSRMWQHLASSGGPQIRSIAVLPLKNLSDDSAQKYFGDGMTEELLTNLSQISALRVISGTSSALYENTHKAIPQIARELNVDAIVTGSVQRSGSRVRVTAQLIYAPQDKTIWARSYDEELRDVLTAQSNMARGIADEIRVKMTPGEQVRRGEPHAVKPEALEAFWRGEYYIKRYGTGSGGEARRTAMQYYERATQIDPQFARAYVGLANAYAPFLSAAGEAASIKSALQHGLRLIRISRMRIFIWRS